jgi:hypothetical protein
LPSPDGRVEAVYKSDMGGGAAFAGSFEVFIVPKGEEVTLNDSVYYANNEVNISWSKDNILHIKYNNADISRFKNYWEEALHKSGWYRTFHPMEVAHDHYKVEVILEKVPAKDFSPTRGK